MLSNRHKPLKITFAASCLGFLLLLSACSEQHAKHELASCSYDIQEHIEQLVSSGDGQGHGPDIGSNEWHGVIEFRLGLNEQIQVPDWHSQAWCDFILKAAIK